MMKYLTTIAAALLLATPALAQKTGAQLNSEISTNFPDQSAGQITPSNLRTVTQDIVNSIMPTAPVVSGNSVCFNGTTGLLKDCGTSPPLSQLANTFYAAPNGSSGLPSFRLQVLADLPSTGNASSLLGNPTGSPAAPAWLTLDPTLAFAGTTLKCTTFGAAQAGCVPASGGGTTAFMRADGSWATPAGGGNVTGPGSSTSGHLTTYSGTTGGVIQDQATVTTAQDIGLASGRPWCDVRAKGAVGDGVTDDSAAFTACLTQLLTTKGFASGIINVPPSANPYCLFSGFVINTGLTTNGGIVLQGGGVQGTNLSACGHTTAPVLTLNNQWIHVRSLTVIGYGLGASDPVFTGTAPSQPAILMSSGCSSCVIEDVYAIGGTAAIQNNGACGYTLSNVWGSFAYGDGAHVFGFFYQISCGGTIWNSHLDMIFPISQPAHGTAIAAWAATHAYGSVGTIVSVSCNARTAWIQLQTAGTSAGSAPNCKPFGQSITDGTAVWQFLNFATSYCIQLDTGSIETEILHTDMTCAASYNFGHTNTFAGTPPSQTHLSVSTPGGSITGNILLDSGTHIDLLGMETSYCMVAGCAQTLIDSANVSNVRIANLDCLNGFAYCINISAAASNISTVQMNSVGADTADFNVAGAATGFMLVNSIHVSGAANLFTVGAVAANHYRIQTNICNSASSSDSATGSPSRLVEPCDGAANHP